MPIPTDHLADLIQQTNERLGNQIRESNQHLADQIEASNDRLAETNQRLTEAIRELAHKVEDGQKGLMDFKVDVADKLGAIRNVSEAIQELAHKVEDGQKGLTDFKVDVADKLGAIRNGFRWMAAIALVIVGVATPVVVNLINSATDRAARTEERIVKLLETLETRGKGKGPVHDLPPFGSDPQKPGPISTPPL